MRMLWLILHNSYYILYIHIRPSIPYIVLVGDNRDAVVHLGSILNYYLLSC